MRVHRRSSDGFEPMTRLCTCAGSIKSTSESNRKRNHLAETSCKTCGGRFLVDGIGFISGNMLSTVGLEVAKPINPELSWKTVTKGRRSRKTVARSLNVGMKVVNRSPKRVGDFSGSDSDKICEAGRPASDKIEHVPIKKRRHLLRSSSPQSHTPCHREESLVLGFERKAALKNGLSDKVIDAKISEVSNRKLYSSEDFSGIALLAAAACINGIDDDPSNGEETHAMVESAAPEGSAGSTSSHSKETSLNPSTGDMVHANNTEFSTVNEPASAQVFAEFDEPSAQNKSFSPKVDRMHWDLNTLMDAWEQPPEDSVMEDTFDRGLNVSAQKYEFKTDICDKTSDLEDYKHDSGKCGSRDQNGAISVSVNLPDVFKPDTVLVHDRLRGEEIFFVDLSRHCVKASDSLSAQRETCGELVIGDASVSAHNNTSCMPVSDGFLTTTTDAGLIMTQSGGSTVKTATFTKDASKCNNSSDPIIPDTSILSAIGVESFESNLTEAHSGNSLSKCEDLAASKVTEGQSVAIEPVELHANILAADSPMELEGKEVLSKFSDSHTSNQAEKCMTNQAEKFMSNQAEKCRTSVKGCDEGLQINDPSRFAKIGMAFEESHNSDISQEDRSEMIGREHMTRIDAGYDSPFEDGELRGSVMYSWLDNEIEDGENECVDYESDGRDGVGSDAADHPASEVVEAGSEGSQSIEKRTASTSGCPEVDFVKGRSPRNFPRRQFNRDDNSVRREGFGIGSGSITHRSVDKIERNEGVFRKGHSSDNMAAFKFRGPYMEDIDSMTNRGKLQSLNEEPLYFDATDGRNTTWKYQSRPHNPVGSYRRPDREGSPDRFIGRYRPGYNSRDRGARNGQWNSWNSRSNYPTAYHGSEGNSYSRRRNYADSSDKFDGVDSRDQRQSVNYSSEGVRRPYIRRRPSVERDDYYDGNRRMVPMRGGYRGRGGAGNFSQRYSRGFREEGYEPAPGDGDLSSVRGPQYLSRVERSGSPTSGRVGRIPLQRRRSRSRSRTRSPHPWHTQRERNFNTRRNSRSPDSRPAARMEHMRTPFRKPAFTYGEDFSSSPRSQCPPERNSRWVDERSFAGEARQKWSPMRRGQRFDPPKSDGYRPMMRPRFESTAGRHNKFENNYDEKGHDNRYEMMHRIRDCGTGVGVRRFEPADAREAFEEGGKRREDLHSLSDLNAGPGVGVRRFEPEAFEEGGNSHSEEDIQSTDQQREVVRCTREDVEPLKE